MGIRFRFRVRDFLGVFKAPKMEESELEEGEACYYNKDDTSIDPDKSFSYIEEKVHNLLGHHVKDFDGGVSSENLGALYGGYGSFLPMYQRSPSVRPQQKTPQRVQTCTTARSHIDLNSEGVSQHSTMPSDVPLALRPGTASRSIHLLLDPKVASANVSATKNSCMLPLQVAENFPLKHNPCASKLVNSSDQRSLKVRIKVGSGNTARKNTAIYSGLGLISPSSSAENSPEESGRMPTESPGTLCESPGSILQSMTSFPVPGSLLLSPLPESMLCLMRKENLPFESKLVLPIKGRQKNSSMFEDDSASMPGDEEVLKGKKKKSGGQREAMEGLNRNAVESEDNMISHLKKSKAKETVKSKQRLPNDLKIKLSSNCITENSLDDPVRAPEAYRESGKDVPVKKREIKKDWARDELLTADMPGKESLESIYGQDYGKYEQQDAKSSSMEHIDERQVRSSCKDFSAVRRDGGRTKDSRALSVSEADSDVSKGEKASITTARGRPERKVCPNSAVDKLDERKVPYSMEKLPFEGKKKSNVSQNNVKSAGNLMEKRVRSGVQASKKDKKSAQKDVQKVRNSYKDVLDTRPECTDSQMKLLERPTGDKAECCKLEAVKEKEALNDGPSIGAFPPEMAMAPVAPVEQENWVCCDRCQKWRLLPYDTKADQLPEVWLCSMLNWLPGMNRCDISEEDTTKALQALYQPVPESQVNLQNHADRAASGVTSADLGQIDQNHRNFNTDAMPNRGKKKHKPKPTGSSSGLMQTSKLTKDFREEAVKSRSLNDMNQPLPETNLKDANALNFGMEGPPKQYEKHANEGDMKHKKLKNKRESDQYDHGTLKKIKTEVAPVANKNWASEHDGDFGRVGHKSNSGLPSRSGGKDMQEYSEKCYSKNGIHEPKDRLVISVKKQRDSTQISLKSGSLDRKACDEWEVHAKKRKLRDWQDSQGYLETSGINGNHLPDGKTYPKEENSDRKFKKEKKSRNSSTEGKESSTSKGDDKSYKKGAVTKIILSAGRDNSVDKNCDKDQQRSKHREKIASQENLDDVYSSRKYLPSERFSMAATSSSSKVSDSRKRAGFQEIRGSPVESVSSSPMRIVKIDKLSSARRDISVKDDSKDGDSIIQTPRKSLDREGIVGTNRSGTARSREASGVFHFESSRLNVLDYHDSDARHKFGGKAESRVKPISKSGNSHLVSNVADTLTGQRQSCTDIHVSDNCSIEGRMNKKHQPDGVTFPLRSGKESSLCSKDKNRSSNLQRVKVKVSDPSGERKLTKKMQMDEAEIERHGLDSHPEELIDARHHFSDQCSTKLNKDGRSVGREKPTKFRDYDGSEVKLDDICSEERGVALRQNVIQGFEAELPKKRVLTQVESTGGKSEINPCQVGKVDELAHVHQPLSRSREGSGFDVHPSDATSDRDVSKVLKQPGDTSHQSGVHSVGNLAPDHCVVRDLSVPCAVKEDTSGQAAKNALKEAEAARDLADRLKDSGFDFGYNEAYFEAALKFLYCASLLEACSSESSRRGEMDQMQIYSVTAKLCETCAQEYEKRKEMAAAALAYKCMEVAYLKLVYCKNSSTNRDRHDLQASLQMIPQGESPSSSASDVDNLNNQATMDKAALSRGIAHTGNHVIVARNRPNFVRLLDFTNDVNSAMEASRKSQNAFAAATLEEAQDKEGIVSVKRVIDFSFQDVEELVRLVRHASKAISPPGFGGNRE